MRAYPPSFAYANAASEKSPRAIAAILFETDSIYLTSHPGVSGVPGVAIQNVLREASAVSQRIVPDEGRSEIGAMTFTVVDKNRSVMDAFRAKQLGGNGLRGKVVRLYQGFSAAAFGSYQVFQTQVIQRVSYKDGVYTVRCADITREQRKDIFDPKVTDLAASIDATATTVQVGSADAFEMIVHNSAWGDAPSSTVGYIRIDDEVIRYTGKTSDSFTGCTRGALNTRAVPHNVDTAQSSEQRTKVNEYIYLELPAVKLILAILTGELHGDSATLPAHWHLGIDVDQWVRITDFTQIGVDLWRPGSDATSFVARFAGLKKTDGKKFLEQELYQLIGCYPIVYADGRLGIKRMNLVLADAASVIELNESNVVSYGELVHDMEGMSNDYVVDWNYVDDGNDERFTRRTRLIDADSIALHGKTSAKSFEFKGLFGSRHTDATVRARIDALRDRYSHPPELIDLELLPSLNTIEVGDISRVKLQAVRDYLGNETSINRSFEVQRTSFSQRSGVSVSLFGSTGRSSTQDPGQDPGGEGPDEENSLPDSWYSSEGTELSTVVNITVIGDVGVTDAGTYTLSGDPDMTDEEAIFYYLGDLTIAQNTTLVLGENVQLRVMGFLTVNGTISGVAGGLEGQADVPGFGNTRLGLQGFFGNSRGMDGVNQRRQTRGNNIFFTVTIGVTVGLNAAVPRFNVSVEAGALVGLPTDLRGTSGGPGGKVQGSGSTVVVADGGTGGDGGAGLCIVCRGTAFGVSGMIDLSGGDSATPGVIAPGNMLRSMYPGAGGAGAPGALLILLDGTNLSLPAITTHFTALTGTVGAPLQNTLPNPSGTLLSGLTSTSIPVEGYLDPAMISNVDYSAAAYQIQYIPGQQSPGEDAPAGVPAPSGLTATGIANGVLLQLTLPAFDQFDSVEIYAASSNDRAGSTQIAQVKANSYVHPLGSGTTRYYWARTRRGSLISDWYPSGATSGVIGTSL